MADILFDQLIMDKIHVNTLLTCLLRKDTTESEDEFLANFGTSRFDFITHLLNFIHEEFPCVTKNTLSTPQKTNTPKRIEKLETRTHNFNIKRRPSLFSDSSQQDSNSENIEINESNSSSTPKNKYLNSVINISNVSYASPVSPLYKNNNSFNASFEAGTRSMCLGDFIKPRKSSSNKKKCLKTAVVEDKTTKRIKPTNLNEKQFNDFGKINNSFNFNENQHDDFDLTEPRKLLLEERMKILRDVQSEDTTNKNVLQLNENTITKIEIIADLNCVTHKKELTNLIDVYVCLLNNNLVLNLTSELYFTVSLLFSKQFKNERNYDDFGVNVLCLEDSKVLKNKYEILNFCKNVHNNVYFAVQTLKKITFINVLDRSTLKLLCENNKINVFDTDLSQRIKIILKKKTNITNHCFIQNERQANICFNLDTDNRLHFPNDPSFQGFKKQRDLFYEIVRLWENNRNHNGWNFQISLGGKIKTLINIGSDPINMVHFARLFLAQLLSTCDESVKVKGLSGQQNPLLSNLAHIDNEKLHRLNNRLTTKQSTNAINTLPIFGGHQEFYMEFILSASSFSFNKHLIDAISTQIVELNDYKFLNPESQTECDEEVKNKFVKILRSLQILAKFLGFLESLPYKSEVNQYTENLLNVQLLVRKNATPYLNVKEILCLSIKNRSLTLTIPWICKYISLLDFVSLRTEYFKSTIDILVYLYQNYNCSQIYNSYLIRFNLGWLFELHHFPYSQFFNLDYIRINNYLAPFTNNSKGNILLDDLCIADISTLYFFCTYLEGIRHLLKANDHSINKVTVKHIKPVTAIESPKEICKKKVEAQIEEAFLNGQPISLRKTIDFVAERIASTCVKHLCIVVIPNLKKIKTEEFHEKKMVWYKSILETNKLEKLRLKVNNLAYENVKILIKECEEEVKRIIKDKLEYTLTNLMALDTLPQTKTASLSITKRICWKRVKQWIKNHISIVVFTREYEMEIVKLCTDNGETPTFIKTTFMLPSTGNLSTHNCNTMSAVQICEIIRNFCMVCLEKNQELQENQVTDILNETFNTLKSRNDVNDTITVVIIKLLVDFSILLVTYRPDILDNETIMNKLICLWRHKNDDLKLFDNIFSMRNIMIFIYGNNKKTWTSLGRFCLVLLKESLVSCDSFENQCTGIFQNDWEKEILRNLTIFLRHFANLYKQDTGSDKFCLILEFMGEFCYDL